MFYIYLGQSVWAGHPLQQETHRVSDCRLRFPQSLSSCQRSRWCPQKGLGHRSPSPAAAHGTEKQLITLWPIYTQHFGHWPNLLETFSHIIEILFVDKYVGTTKKTKHFFISNTGYGEGYMTCAGRSSQKFWRNVPTSEQQCQLQKEREKKKNTVLLAIAAKLLCQIFFWDLKASEW